MEFNPHDRSFAQAQTRVADLTSKASALQERVSWFERTDPEKIRQELRDGDAVASDLKVKLSAIETAIVANRHAHAEASAEIGSRLDPRNWFSKGQTALKHRCQELEVAHTKLQKNAASKADKLKTALDRMKDLRATLERHEAFDGAALRKDLHQIKQDLANEQAALDVVAKLKAPVDLRLRSIVEQYRRLQAEIQDAESKLGQARYLEGRLSAAPNTYERRLVHKECESALQFSSPRKVIADQERRIAGLKRDLEKTRVRASEIGRKAARVIRTLVVDGNNLCYEGDRFIGLAALDVLLPELTRARRVVLVFDSAIRRILGVNDATLRDRFTGSEVHVVATSQLADDTILGLASPDPATYVLSNDRFGDYNEARVVQERRVIRHEIVAGRTLISDLDINLPYQRGDAAS